MAALWIWGAAAVLYGADIRLVDAVEKQDKALIRRLLTERVDVNAAQVDGMTALHWAVYLDDLQTTQAILDLGGDADAKTRYAVTPISLACTNGNASIVQLLLERGADPNATLLGGETVLMTAARTGRVGPVRALLAKGANVNAKETNDQTALMWAAAEGHLDVVNVLLDAGADFKTPLDSGYSPLLFAVRQGHVKIVNRLLDAGADVNTAMRPKNSSGRNVDDGTTALILAIENGHFELAVELLKAGADPNESRTGFTPLQTMSWVRKPPVGDNADGLPSPEGSGRLSSLQCVEALVQFGADVNFRKQTKGGRGKFGRKGTTALLCAAGTGDAPFLRKLLDLGADPHIPNEVGWTPLMMACGMGTGADGDSAGTEPECLEAVKLLVGLGADVNAVDQNGETPMHGAAYKTMPSVVKYLHEHGADIQIWSQPSKSGRMPLWIAQGYRGGGNFKPSFETVDLIKEIMTAQGMTPPPPPKQKRRKGYQAQ